METFSWFHFRYESSFEIRYIVVYKVQSNEFKISIISHNIESEISSHKTIFCELSIICKYYNTENNYWVLVRWSFLLIESLGD